MMRSFLLSAFALLAIVSAGCGPRGEPDSIRFSQEALTTIETWPATLPTDGGGFAVTVNPSTIPIPRSKHFSLDVTIENGGAQASDLKVVVDADMPAHRHGMNTQPEIVAAGDHRYRVDGMLFHMAGDWTITVDITTANGAERAVFPVHIE